MAKHRPNSKNFLKERCFLLKGNSLQCNIAVIICRDDQVLILHGHPAVRELRTVSAVHGIRQTQHRCELCDQKHDLVLTAEAVRHFI